ncbi:UNVERIFIED_CONTAM: Oligopeptide transporter 5 [Sesamum indicum]
MIFIDKLTNYILDSTIYGQRSMMPSESNAIMPEDEVSDSPIEEVRLTVPITDDPTLPCLTFRTWVLGILSCAALAFLNQFLGYRQNAISVTSVSAQILVLPLGKLMAASLPRKAVKVPGTKWSFSTNPGPFNLKEHGLITIFANAGSNAGVRVGWNFQEISGGFTLHVVAFESSSGFLGSPLATPGFAIINVLVGFILIVYVVLPIAYWNDMYNAKRFPIISSHVFDANGGKYNLPRVLNDKTFDFYRAGYDSYSKVNLSVFFVLSYGTSFATLAATVSHVALFHGRMYKGWWARHNYILSAGLDAGVAFMATLCFFTLQNYIIGGPSWWGLDVSDHCPLAYMLRGALSSIDSELHNTSTAQDTITWLTVHVVRHAL